MDKKNLSPEETQALRRQALEYLAARHPLTWTQKQIAQGLQMRGMVDFAFGVDDLGSALEVLAGKKLVEKEPDPLGATVYWRPTAEGLIEWERRH